MNIALLLQMASDAGPGRVALSCQGRHWTYPELQQASQGAAALLQGSHYDSVALLDEASAAAPIALFGAALAGIPYVPLNYRLADEDLAAQLQRISPTLLIGDTQRTEQVYPQGLASNCTSSEFIAAAGKHAQNASGEEREGTGIAAQIFTSGTTATPKAALLRHSNLMSYILGTVEFCSAAESDAQLVCVPPYHIAGISALLSSIYAMRRIVLLRTFDPDEWLKFASAEQVTNAFLVPTMLARVIERIDAGVECDLGSLRAIAYGGGRMPTALIKRALELFPDTDFTNAYGLTETSSTISLLGPQDHRLAHTSSDPDIRARLHSVGQALPTIELQIRNDQGQVLPAGEAGEIYVKGEQVSGEYKERTALDTDGWFPTRDAGWLDTQGYLFLTGRADDVIVRGAENISPGEIEDALLSHPAVADAAAVGVPSQEWGESVGVAIVIKPGHDTPTDKQLQDLVRQRLRSSRVPEHLRVVASLPYNEMGKLLRREIRALFPD